MLRNQRRHRDEIRERKQFEKQKGIISAIVISTALQDGDYEADQVTAGVPLNSSLTWQEDLPTGHVDTSTR